jgi:hypothetical protein
MSNRAETFLKLAAQFTKEAGPLNEVYQKTLGRGVNAAVGKAKEFVTRNKNWKALDKVVPDKHLINGLEKHLGRTATKEEADKYLKSHSGLTYNHLFNSERAVTTPELTSHFDKMHPLSPSATPEEIAQHSSALSQHLKEHGGKSSSQYYGGIEPGKGMNKNEVNYLRYRHHTVPTGIKTGIGLAAIGAPTYLAGKHINKIRKQDPAMRPVDDMNNSQPMLTRFTNEGGL